MSDATRPTKPKSPIASFFEQAGVPRTPHRFGRRPPVEAPAPWLIDGRALFREATAHARSGRLEAAVAAFDTLIRLSPDHADALNDRGNALDLLRRRPEALDSYERALRADPDHRHAANGRANLLQAFGRLDEAIAAYEAVLAKDPRYVHAWNGLGNALMALNRHRDALDAYARALAIAPSHPDANFNEGIARLSLGDFDVGWRKHEWRWKLPAWRTRQRGFAQPLWLGAPGARGRRLLLHAEQGFGDTLQFCRYVPLAAARDVSVILEVQPALRTLLGQLPGVDTLVARGEPLPGFDLQCPLLSLPLAFGTQGDTVPASPRFVADAERTAAWAARLGTRERLRVGVAWQGNTGHDNDRNRSIPFERFATLLHPSFDAVSLQPQVLDRDRAALERPPRLRHFGDALRDFADTAALVAQVDVVVAVDTSVAHLAAAMGRPVWLLLPWVADWRWLIDRDDSPWYPSMRLFRQPRRDDWAPVLERVRDALVALAQRDSPGR